MDLGHGFIPRIDVGNYKALDRVLGPRSLFDPVELDLPWVILDGSWVHTQGEFLNRLRRAGVRYLIDTSAWRFQSDSALDVQKLARLGHAPDGPWAPSELAEFFAFVSEDLRFQAGLGASAYLVPGLIPKGKDVDLADADARVAEVVKAVAFDSPMPAIVTVGAHTTGLAVAARRIEHLSPVYDGVYVQATPVDPYNDSVSKLAGIIELLLKAGGTGRSVIAGRLGAMTDLLRSLGIDAADAGLGAGETFDLASKLRKPTPQPDGQPRPRSSLAHRRYVRQIRRSLAPALIEAIEAVPAAEAHIRCVQCCQLLAPADRVRRGREHSLVARIAEAVEISSLPTMMRAERVDREWTAARRSLTAVNRALADAGVREMKPDYLDNQIALLRQVLREASDAA